MLQQPLPDRLGHRFNVSDALLAGVSPARLRDADLDRPFHGVRRCIAERRDPVLDFTRAGRKRGHRERAHLQRALDYSERMTEHEFFCRVTAAVIHEVPLPSSLLEATDLDVAVLSPRRLPRSKGVRGHQAVPRQTVVQRDSRTGLRVADPATTWAMLGAVLAHPHDLVAAGDAVVRDWRAEPLATIAELQQAIGRGRRVGIGRLRAAIPDVRTRSASRPETRTRCAIVEGGLPEPELNYDVYEAGVRLACVDLAYPRLRIAIEYEGEHHLMDPVQWARDIARYDRLIAAGWLVIRVTKSELFQHPEQVARRVRAAIAARS
jgi:hypothetical protein